MGCPILHTEQLVSKQREIRTRLMPGPLDEEEYSDFVGGYYDVFNMRLTSTVPLMNFAACTKMRYWRHLLCGHTQTAGATRGSSARRLEVTIPHNEKTELTWVVEIFKDKMTTRCLCMKTGYK